MKKLFSLFLTVLLCFTAIGSNTVFAASGVLQEDRTNQAEFHLLNGSAGWEGTYYWWGLATIGGQPDGASFRLRGRAGGVTGAPSPTPGARP